VLSRPLLTANWSAMKTAAMPLDPRFTTFPAELKICDQAIPVPHVDVEQGRIWAAPVAVPICRIPRLSTAVDGAEAECDRNEGSSRAAAVIAIMTKAFVYGLRFFPDIILKFFYFSILFGYFVSSRPSSALCVLSTIEKDDRVVLRSQISA